MEVYRPAEDSFLLAKHVERLTYGKVLDMGTGSGIQAVTAAKKKEVSRVIAVDINPEALVSAREWADKDGVLSKIEFVFSDLFENIAGCYDWILFNAPYLPSEGKVDEVSWVGGEIGSEVIKRFFKEASDYLSDGGQILLVYSSLSGMMDDDFMGYNIEFVEENQLFFEKILCVKLNPF
jgi:release factor glutamine methyltransferase